MTPILLKYVDVYFQHIVQFESRDDKSYFRVRSVRQFKTSSKSSAFKSIFSIILYTLFGNVAMASVE